MEAPVPPACGEAILAEERARVLVLGCGNVLWGDDGFGPAVARALDASGRLPEDVACLDAGTGVRSILFDVVLSERRPRRVIVIDAMDFGEKPGTVAVLGLDALPPLKTDDFSMHQVPTSNMLRELRDVCGVEVVLVACQPAEIPEAVRQGLSDVMRGAVPEAVRRVLERCAPEMDMA